MIDSSVVTISEVEPARELLGFVVFKLVVVLSFETMVVNKVVEYKVDNVVDLFVVLPIINDVVVTISVGKLFVVPIKTFHFN